MKELAVEHEPGEKRTIKFVSILFFAVLLLLTLYSNTILTMNLPKVSVEEGRSEPLVQNYNGSGLLQPISHVDYQLALQIPSSIVDQLEIGTKQNIEVKIKGATQSLEGVITGIEPMEAVDPVVPIGVEGESASSQPIPLTQVLVSVQSPELQGGEQASMTLSKSFEVDNGVLLPLKAIHGEGANTYIFVMEEEKGPLGNTYHASKMAVEVGEANEYEIVVLKGAFPGQSIITESSKPLQDGSRVRKG